MEQDTDRAHPLCSRIRSFSPVAFCRFERSPSSLSNLSRNHSDPWCRSEELETALCWQRCQRSLAEYSLASDRLVSSVTISLPSSNEPETNYFPMIDGLAALCRQRYVAFLQALTSLCVCFVAVGKPFRQSVRPIPKLQVRLTAISFLRPTSSLEK